VWGQQVRFHDQEALAERVLAEIGPEGVPAARMLMLRFAARQLIDEAARAPSLGDLDVALAIARQAGDVPLELEALYSRAAERLVPDDEEFDRLEALARSIDAWDRLSVIVRMRAAMRFPDAPRQTLALAPRVREVGEAASLAETLAWADYLEAEAAFELGEDEVVMDRGLAAIEAGIANAYHRVVVRTWYPVLPVAVRRGDDEIVARAARWFEEHAGLFPDTPYAHVMHGGVDLLLAAAGAMGPVVPDLRHLRSGFEEWTQLPTWFDAVIRHVQAWLDRGDVDVARSALEVFAAASVRYPWRFGAATVALLEARILDAEGADAAVVYDRAEEAARLFASVEAAPWAADAAAFAAGA
jgi:hypothetical protein